MTTTTAPVRPLPQRQVSAPTHGGATVDPLEVSALARKVLATAAGDNRRRQAARRLPRHSPDAPAQTLVALMHSAEREIPADTGSVQVLRGRVIVSGQNGPALLSAGEQRRLPRAVHRLEASRDAVLLLTARA